VIWRPTNMGSFEFVVLATLRTGQLTRGCLPRVTGDHTKAVIAQREVAEGLIVATASPSSQAPVDPQR
jgi:DNA-directed RNA polymerase subunit K/omega